MAEIPVPDFLLFDKMIALCKIKNIDVAIAVNKSDLGAGVYEKIKRSYGDIAENIFVFSAKTGEGIEPLKEFLKGGTVVLAGQSAVGKTSIINRIFGENRTVGDVSRKTLKGKQTTTFSEIIIKDGIKIVDTPGFTSLDADISSDEVALGYPEFISFSVKCRFSDCSHITEPDCAVKKAAENGIIDRERYSRYVKIYNEVKEREKEYGKRN